MTPISFARFRFGLEGFESITMSESMSYQGRPRAARAAKKCTGDRNTATKNDHLLVVNEDLDLSLVHNVEVVSFLALFDDLVTRPGKGWEHGVKDFTSLHLVQMAEQHLRVQIVVRDEKQLK